MARSARASSAGLGERALGSIQRLARRWNLETEPGQLAIFIAALPLAIVASAFGGASQTNALSLTAVELASVPLLAISVSRLIAEGPPRHTWFPILILVGLAAVPIVQLIPLPPQIWTGLPGRGAIGPIFDAAHLGRPALSLSLTPDNTWRALLALVPPAAMFLGALSLGERERRIMLGCWMALAAVSIVIGALQMIGGPDSPLYFYSITNNGTPVGLFANRNHQAAFIYALVPPAAVVAAQFRGRLADPRAIASLLAILYVAIAIIGVAVTRSRAGIALLIGTLLASFLLALRTGAFRRHRMAALGLGLGGTAALGAVLLFALDPILDRFSEVGGKELRFEGWPIVLEAAKRFLPFGSGIGSFDAIYTAAEPLSQVSPVYFNHAHDDFLELWLETGVIGAGLLAAFLIWLGLSTIRLWSGSSDKRGMSGASAACTVVVTALLAHSMVDYPLRTEAIAVLFAFACAVVARPHRQTQSRG